MFYIMFYVMFYIIFYVMFYEMRQWRSGLTGVTVLSLLRFVNGFTETTDNCYNLQRSLSETSLEMVKNYNRINY